MNLIQTLKEHGNNVEECARAMGGDLHQKRVALFAAIREEQRIKDVAAAVVARFRRDGIMGRA